MTAAFGSLLVANRGEIACRIFRTARAMGIRTIAVYSDADAKAKHVREADVAVHIGAAPASESYLRADKVLAAAKEAGAAAVHPGYGFLSENPEFAEAVIAASMIWVGPTPDAIRAMGLKDEAKRIAIAAGVPVLSGYQGEDQREDTLLSEAKKIGFPVLIKAVAGGGGRGIREVKAAGEFKEQLASAQREAKAAFGDERVLIEKLVERPRHIEVQVFGDKHGGLVHMFERDCSLQRRRQKVIEEAPAPGMTEEVRAAMTDAALKVARAVKYENAGTVEFIVDGNGPLRPDGFWFLEMNTRLQVEHPVTEAITGLDLVQWQLLVAAGKPLPRQKEITLNGHAVEARLCAEDPSEGFRPSVGRIRTLAFDGYSRVDAGFEAGDTVSSSYDSLIAKEITHAPTRDEAIYHARVCLGRVHVEGVTTNGAFLQRCLADSGFASGALHTGIIAERIDTLADRDASRRRAAACAASALANAPAASASIWEARDGWRLNASPRRTWMLEEGGVVVSVEPGASLTIDGAATDFLLEWVDEDEIQGDMDGAPFRARHARAGSRITILLAGESFTFARPGAEADRDMSAVGDDIKAPLPGKIVAFTARVGANVKKGDALVTLEAMKMEHALKAPRDGVVAEVGAVAGAQVNEGAMLVRLEPAA